MKLRLPSGLLLDALTLPAEPSMDADERVVWRVWCVHCGEWQHHEPGDGHRVTSMPRGCGYLF